MRTAHAMHSGLRTGSENLAIDRTWLTLHAQGQRPDLLRFYRSHACASVGRYQAIDRELRTYYCAQHHIEMLRRITGGGALYTDPQQLGFSLIATNSTSLENNLKLACEAIVLALQELGIHACHALPNDVEIEGKKIASVFAAFEAGSFLLHGSLLLDTNIKTMLEALRAPTEKISPDGLAAARDRLATLADYADGLNADVLQAAISAALAEKFVLELLHAVMEDEPAQVNLSGIPQWEHANAFRIDWRDTSQDYLEVLCNSSGGLLRCRAAFDKHDNKVRHIEFAANFQSPQSHFLTELQQVLTGLPTARIAVESKRFFLHRHIAIPGVNDRDFMHLIGLLLDKFSTRRLLDLTVEQANTLMVHSTVNLSSSEILHRASVMLVPYCAKPDWCKWRHMDGCTECGLCEVGAAYRLARDRGMRVTTITHYEHLVETLKEMQTDGVTAYVGMCCSQFFIKRHRAFREAGIPALLMDISGANCYELKQEHDAYAGTFSAQATLDENLLQKVMQYVPAGELS